MWIGSMAKTSRLWPLLEVLGPLFPPESDRLLLTTQGPDVGLAGRVNQVEDRRLGYHSQ